MTKELKTAVDAAKQAMRQRSLILEKIAEGEQELRELEGEIEVARARLGSAEADVALGGDAKASTAAKKGLAQLREQAETVEARIGGLRNRLAQSTAELPEQSKRLRQASHAEFQAELAKWMQGYRNTVEQLRSSVLEGLALQQAFGSTISGLAEARELLNVRAVDEQGRAIAPVSASRMAGPDFPLAPSAMTTIERYAEARELGRSLEHTQRAIEQSARDERDRLPASERRAQAVLA